MVASARVGRWSALAGRRRSDGGRGWRARRAWRRLLDAVARGDVTAVEAVWREWLHRPTEDGWVVGDASTEEVVARDERVRFGQLCALHGLVPVNPVDRAVFYVLTGQTALYEAVDPDGSLFVAAYRGSAEQPRKALRQAMVASGGLDVARVIADRPDRLLDEPEADHLAAHLADTRQWDRLWRLLPTMPFANAARAARLIEDWSPADADARAFLTRLATADPEAIAVLTTSMTSRIETPHVREVSIAPDGTEIAVTHYGGTDIVRGGHAVRTDQGFGFHWHSMLALGDATAVGIGGKGLVRRRIGQEGPSEVLLTHPSRPCRTEAGFVATGLGDARSVDLITGSADGPLSRAGMPADGDRRRYLVAADPASRHLVFHEQGRGVNGRSDLVVVDAESRVLARTPPGGYPSLDEAPGADGGTIDALSGQQHQPRAGFFLGTERILLWSSQSHEMSVWRRDGTDLVRSARYGVFLDLPPVPVGDRVLVLVRPRPVFLDAETLTPVDPPTWFPSTKVSTTGLSPDGSLAAVATATDVEVYDLALRRLTHTPLAAAAMTDLTTVSGRIWSSSPKVGAALELLKAALEYRFGTDVALGRTAPISPRDDDIALGGG